MAMTAVASACSSGSPRSGPGPSRNLVNERASDATGLLAQCAITQHVQGVIASARKYSGMLPASQRWLQGDRIVLTRDSSPQFSGWFQGHLAGVVLHGRTFDRWDELAARTGKLPAAVCGSGISARQLHDQIYAQFPRAKKNNPWRT
jgi:hypothetical protein